MASGPQVHAISVSKSHFGDMESQASAHVIEDLGIEGDRYAVKRGMNRAKRQVLLMDKETIDLLGLNPGTVRENITTEGFDIYSLEPGQKVRIGVRGGVGDHGAVQPVRADGCGEAGPEGGAGGASGDADAGGEGRGYCGGGWDLGGGVVPHTPRD